MGDAVCPAMITCEQVVRSTQLVRMQMARARKGQRDLARGDRGRHGVCRFVALATSCELFLRGRGV